MFFSGSRLAIAMIAASASSTTLRVLENGALNTATPRLLAAARSIWLTPMQNAPIAASCGAAARTRSVTCVPELTPRRPTSPIAQLGAESLPVGRLRARPDAEQVHVPDGLDELVFAERRRRRLGGDALLG